MQAGGSGGGGECSCIRNHARCQSPTPHPRNGCTMGTNGMYRRGGNIGVQASKLLGRGLGTGPQRNGASRAWRNQQDECVSFPTPASRACCVVITERRGHDAPCGSACPKAQPATWLWPHDSQLHRRGSCLRLRAIPALVTSSTNGTARYLVNPSTPAHTPPHSPSRLQAPDGHTFINPFNRGCSANCREACLPDSAPTAPVFLSKEQQEAAMCGVTGGGCKHCH